MGELVEFIQSNPDPRELKRVVYITVVDLGGKPFAVMMISSYCLKSSSPIRPMQNEFKGPNFGKQKPPYPTLHFPQTQLDDGLLLTLNTAREPAAAKGGEALSEPCVIGST